MCGINVYFGKDKSVIERMAAKLEHRGKRTTTARFFQPGLVYVSHARLPIQGLSETFDQPMRHGTKNLYGLMVGEVFNFRKYDPAAKNDLAVVLAMWEKFGPKCLAGFDGFWSFVFIDTSKKTVTVVTDPLAKKPLYYRTLPALAISSEIDPLLEAGPSTLNETYLGGVARFGYCYDRSTPWNEIHSIAPGSILVYDEFGRLKESYQYGLGLYPTGTDLRAAVEESVRNRMVSDVPVGVLLSGGLDSTIVFEMMKKVRTDFKVFHVENDEADFLKHLDFRFPGSEIEMIAINRPVEIEKEVAVQIHQCPVDLGSVMAQIDLGKAVRESGVDVVLSGDGADELFGGYRRTAEYDSQKSDVFHELIHYHLPRLDRTMMFSMVELRCPFLALPIVNYALALPWERRKHKEVLKEAFADIVPLSILHREKVPLKIEGSRGEKKIEWRMACIDAFRKAYAT